MSQVTLSRVSRARAVRARRVLSRLALVCLGLLAAGALTGPPSGARAQDGGEPVVTARLFAPITGEPIAVEPTDDNDENLRLRGPIADALAAQGRVVATTGAAPLLLRYSTDRPTNSVMQQVGPADRNNAPGALPMRDDGFGGSVPLDTQKPTAARRVEAHAVRYRLQATLEGRGTGQVLWRGEAVGGTHVNQNDEARLGRELAAALMAEFGRTHQP